MEFTNEKTAKFNPQWINEQTVYYCLVSLGTLLLYLFTEGLLRLYLPELAAQLICAVPASATYFYLANRFVFAPSRRTLAPRILFFLFQCGIDAGLYYGLAELALPYLEIEKALMDVCTFVLIGIINYFFSAYLVFSGSRSAKKRIHGRLFCRVIDNRFVLLSGAVAAFIILFVYFCYNAFPFGDITILRMDLYHQYGPLYAELYDRVANGQGLLYSWVSGGGSLFLGNFFNYLSSPLSLLIFLFERDQIPGAISFIIAAKAALSAASFTFYLKQSQRRSSYVTAGFGLLYAFCGYFLAYYWNVMWIDALYLLPMIVLGIEQIIHHRRCKLYMISLILMMFSNYYMSFILCIFSVLYFLSFYFSHYAISATLKAPQEKAKKLKKLWNSRLFQTGLIFAGASIFAAAVAAAALLPIYFALQSSSATGGTFPTEVNTYFDLFDFLGNHLTGIETTIRSSGGDVLPNISSGMIVLILVPLYMMNRGIPLKEKAWNILLLAILVVSFNTNVLNYIWHAFHYPNDLPYRFSFLYSFLLLVMSFRVLTQFKKIRYRDIVLVGMLVLLFITLCEKMPNKYFKEDLTLYVSIAFTVLYAGIFALIKKKSLGASVLSFLLFLTMGVEIIVGSTDSYVLSQSHTNYAGDYENYQKVLKKIALYEKGSADKPRTEQFSLRARMDPCWYGYNGISTFSSMAYENMSALQYNMGMYGNRINSYTYHAQTPVYNSMFAIKYLIAKSTDPQPNPEYYTKLFTDGGNSITVYQSNYYLPLAFCVDPNIDNWYHEEGNPFEVQNSFIRSASGINEVFYPLSVQTDGRLNIKDFNFNGNGTFTYEKYNEGDASITFEITAKENGNIYLYASSYGTSDATVVSDRVDVSYHFDTPYILDAGYHQAGETITVTFTMDDAMSSTLSFYSYSIDNAAFEAAYTYFQQGAYQITESADNNMTGNVTADKTSVLYTSIPYDEGWSVLVDGEKTQIFPVGDALIGLMLQPGTHTVTFRYQPKGLMPGLCITGASLLLFAAYSIFRRLRLGKSSSLLPQEKTTFSDNP